MIRQYLETILISLTTKLARAELLVNKIIIVIHRKKVKKKIKNSKKIKLVSETWILAFLVLTHAF